WGRLSRHAWPQAYRSRDDRLPSDPESYTVTTMTPTPFAAGFEQNPAPKTPAERDAILAEPGFGNHFTDHMFLAEWTPDTGWANGRVVPYGPLLIDPATAVLHYAQEIFEGLKAYVHADGSAWLFRPEANGARMQRSAH